MSQYKSLLNPEDAVLVLIDCQQDLAIGHSEDKQEQAQHNAVMLARAARLFTVPIALTRFSAESGTGEIWPLLLEAVGKDDALERSCMNPWEDPRFLSTISGFGRRRLVLAGLWTEGAICFAALSALEEGYDVYVMVDATSATSSVAHDVAVTRMVQAGVVPLTSRQVLLEWQRTDRRKVLLAHVMAPR